MWPIVLGGVFIVAGVGTAVVMGIEKQSAQSSADSVAQTILANGGGQSTCYGTPTAYYANACAALNSDDNNVNTDATIANVGIGLAIAGVVLNAIYIPVALATRHHAQSVGAPPIVFSPLVGRGLRGMALGATF